MLQQTFFQSTDHIGLAKWQRRNARLNDAISRECANGVSNKNIGEKYRISTATVERQLHRNHAALLREQLNYPCPQVLGIDEHSIHRGRTKGSNLTTKQKELLQKEFAQHPAIQTAHEFKEELCSLLCMKQQTRINCVPLLKRLKEMVWMLIHDAPEAFKN